MGTCFRCLCVHCMHGRYTMTACLCVHVSDAVAFIAFMTDTKWQHVHESMFRMFLCSLHDGYQMTACLCVHVSDVFVFIAYMTDTKWQHVPVSMFQTSLCSLHTWQMQNDSLFMCPCFRRLCGHMHGRYKLTACSCVRVSDAFVPVQIFWSDSREASEFQRCGGLMSHLNRTLGSKCSTRGVYLWL